MHLLNINHCKKAHALSRYPSLVGRGDLAEKLPSKSFGTIRRMRRLLFNFGSGLDPIKRLRESCVCLTTSDSGREYSTVHLNFWHFVNPQTAEYRNFCDAQHVAWKNVQIQSSMGLSSGRLLALSILDVSFARSFVVTRNHVFFFRSNFVQSPIKRKGRKRRTERWRFFRLHGEHSTHVVLESLAFDVGDRSWS